MKRSTQKIRKDKTKENPAQMLDRARKYHELIGQKWYHTFVDRNDIITGRIAHLLICYHSNTTRYTTNFYIITTRRHPSVHFFQLPIACYAQSFSGYGKSETSLSALSLSKYGEKEKPVAIRPCAHVVPRSTILITSSVKSSWVAF